MGRGDKNRNLYLWVVHDFLGQDQRLPVGVQGLVRAAWAGHPSRHADAVAVVAVYRLDQVDDFGTVQALGKDRRAVERIVDALVDKAVRSRVSVAVVAFL